jgi:hypothetical protein
MDSSRAGQSLLELLIAIVVGMIFMVGISVVVISSLSESGQALKIQTASASADSLLNNIRVWSEGGWSNILSLATGSANQYYLITSSSPYTATTGIQSVAVATTTYQTYFYLSDAYRTSSGAVTSTASGNTYDPSTKKISVVYYWVGGSTTSTMTSYMTRNGDSAFVQTDWSGGPNPSAVATSVSNQFASSTTVDYTTTTGAVYVAIPGY